MRHQIFIAALRSGNSVLKDELFQEIGSMAEEVEFDRYQTQCLGHGASTSPKPEGGFWTSSAIDGGDVSEWSMWVAKNVPNMDGHRTVLIPKAGVEEKVIEFWQLYTPEFAAFRIGNIILWDKLAESGYFGVHFDRNTEIPVTSLVQGVTASNVREAFDGWDVESTIWFRKPSEIY